MLDIKTLEGWLWDAACSIRGSMDAPKFKDYILPLVFVKRLSDVFENELKKLGDLPPIVVPLPVFASPFRHVASPL